MVEVPGAVPPPHAVAPVCADAAGPGDATVEQAERDEAVAAATELALGMLDLVVDVTAHR